MAGIFPRNGLAPGLDNSGIDLTTTPVSGCEALYYDERCNTKMDPKEANAVLSELVSVFNAAGITYDCRIFTNLLQALLQLICDNIIKFADTSPTATDTCPPLWFNRVTGCFWVYDATNGVWQTAPGCDCIADTLDSCLGTDWRLINTGPQGPAGPTGPQGPQGPAGADGTGVTVTAAGGFVNVSPGTSIPSPAGLLADRVVLMDSAGNLFGVQLVF